MAQTASFALIRFSVAFSICDAPTADMWVGSAQAPIAPTLNALAHHFHTEFWAGIERRRAFQSSPTCVQARFSH